MLKREYAKKDDIPEALQEHYTEKDGKWILSVEADGGGGGGDKSKVDEFRRTNIELAKERDSLKTEIGRIQKMYEGIDPEVYRKHLEAMERIKADEEKALIAEGKIDEVVQRRTAAAITAKDEALTARNEAYGKLERERDTLKSKLGSLLIGNAVQVEIGSQNLRVRPGALPDVLSRTQGAWKIDKEGNTVPVASDGNGTAYGEDGTVLKMPEFVKKLLETAPHLFEPAKGGGAEGGDGLPQKDGLKQYSRTALMAGQVGGDPIKEMAEGKAALGE